MQVRKQLSEQQHFYADSYCPCLHDNLQLQDCNKSINSIACKPGVTTYDTNSLHTEFTATCLHHYTNVHYYPYIMIIVLKYHRRAFRVSNSISELSAKQTFNLTAWTSDESGQMISRNCVTTLSIRKSVYIK